MAGGFVYLIVCATTLLCVYGHGNNEGSVDVAQSSGSLNTVNEDHLILLNVAAKGRVVELLANELARTEIIRALLVEYARECARNVTGLEKACLHCMLDRCNNRVQECGLQLPPLAEVVDHKTSPIKGLEFLSTPPTAVKDHMQKFVKIARPDVLADVPDKLMSESKQIVQEDLDQSLRDLSENLDTDTVLHKLTLHVHGKKNVKTKTLGNGVLVVISDYDHRTNIADVLARKLKESRPFLESVKDRMPEVMENVPAVVDQLGAQLEDFRNTISDVFSNMLDNFQQNADFPNTAVYNDNRQFRLRQRLHPAFRQQSIMFPQQVAQTMQRMPVQMNPGQFAQQMLTNQNQFQQGQALIQANLPGQSGQMTNIQVQQPMLSGNQGNPSLPMLQQQNALMAGVIGQELMEGNAAQLNQQQQVAAGQWQGQIPHGQHMHGQGQPHLPTAQTQVQGGNFPRQSPTPAFQSNPVGRRKRADVTCSNLKQDPNKYCKMFESQCFNCTKEKRLRFEVCGEGVERARDEIKRLDKSVAMYLEAFENHIVGNRLILKIELDDKKRLHKSNSYEETYITAKVGPSVLRFQSKHTLNINNIRVSGSQIGDALWEKLWDEHVFKEAERVEIPPGEKESMGQTHDLNTKKTKTSEKTAAAKHSSACSQHVSVISITVGVIVSALVVFF